MKPHRVRAWLNPTIDDEAAWLKQAKTVCSLYERARELAAEGVRVVSCDEKTGMQALERMAPARPTAPGKAMALESWYRRHGTCCLTANFDVATGQIVSPTLGKTRGNLDFLHHVVRTVDSSSQEKWIFIVDNLNCHTSAELVRYVARVSGFKGQLGVKGKSGILKNMRTRANFLTRDENRVRFVYTPKHCSWMNAVESWFGQLSRKLLKRLSSDSIEQLKQKVRRFIDWHNLCWAKPLEWTWKPRLPKGITETERQH